MKHYTYWIIDHLNGLYYHGVHSSTKPESIRAYHGSSNALNEAIKLHGIENFTKRVERYFPTRDAANLHETRVHERLDVRNHHRFYNMVNGHPFENYAKPGQPLSDKLLKAIRSPKARAKLSVSKTGVALPHDDEWNRKISESKKGKSLSEEHKQALRKPKQLSEESRKGHSDRIKEMAANPMHRRIKNSTGVVLTEVDTGRDFYVLNISQFGADMVGNPKIAAKIQGVLRGERKSASGFTARHPTEDEVEALRPILFDREITYVEIDKG